MAIETTYESTVIDVNGAVRAAHGKETTDASTVIDVTGTVKEITCKKVR